MARGFDTFASELGFLGEVYDRRNGRLARRFAHRVLRSHQNRNFKKKQTQQTLGFHGQNGSVDRRPTTSFFSESEWAYLRETEACFFFFFFFFCFLCFWFWLVGEKNSEWLKIKNSENEKRKGIISNYSKSFLKKKFTVKKKKKKFILKQTVLRCYHVYGHENALSYRLAAFGWLYLLFVIGVFFIKKKR